MTIVFDELVSRYEEPDERNRWDSPLFTIIYDDKQIPGDKLWDAVILKKPPPPNKSTVSKPVSSTNYVYELDKATLEIINAFVEQQKELGPGGMPMTVPRSATLEIINAFVEQQKELGPGGMPMTVPRSTVKVINPSRTVTLSELRRLRKQFVTCESSW
ncbi:hypothetical protein RMCBS344292_00219 [Rhizopus microsporus]|nr:hypothetical protein RMCBS344292_00219 [Rhizopus microsporus]